MLRSNLSHIVSEDFSHKWNSQFIFLVSCLQAPVQFVGPGHYLTCSEIRVECNGILEDRGQCSVAKKGREVVVAVTVSGKYSGPVTRVDEGKKGGGGVGVGHP